MYETRSTRRGARYLCWARPWYSRLSSRLHHGTPSILKQILKRFFYLSTVLEQQVIQGSNSRRGWHGGRNFPTVFFQYVHRDPSSKSMATQQLWIIFNDVFWWKSIKMFLRLCCIEYNNHYVVFFWCVHEIELMD